MPCSREMTASAAASASSAASALYTPPHGASADPTESGREPHTADTASLTRQSIVSASTAVDDEFDASEVVDEHDCCRVGVADDTRHAAGSSHAGARARPPLGRTTSGAAADDAGTTMGDPANTASMIAAVLPEDRRRARTPAQSDERRRRDSCRAADTAGAASAAVAVSTLDRRLRTGTGLPGTTTGDAAWTTASWTLLRRRVVACGCAASLAPP